jgi:hypothetical protein
MFNALKRLMDRALYEGQGMSFFVPKSITDPGFDAVQLNFYLLNTINEFNNRASEEHQIPVQMSKFRSYFLQKVTLSTNLKQAFHALHGLKVTSKAAPFLRVIDQNESKVRL